MGFFKGLEKTSMDWKSLFKKSRGVDYKAFRKSLGLGPKPNPEKFEDIAKVVSKLYKRHLAKKIA